MKARLRAAYMQTARTFAELSHAKRMKVGAIVVKDDRILSIGYNGTPSGWDNTCEEIVDGELVTRSSVIHAEANCLAKLSKSHDTSTGASMFTTLSPCIHCAKQIYTAGITDLYYDIPYRDMEGIEFLELAGISIQQL